MTEEETGGKKERMTPSNPYASIIALLQEHHVPYTEREHDPMFTSDQEEEMTGLSAKQGIKSLLLKAKNEFVLVLLPGDKKLDTQKAKEAMKTKSFRFATEEEVQQVMGCAFGACYPFGSVAHLRTFADASFSDSMLVACNPGVHDKSLLLSYQDFQRVEQPSRAVMSQ
jgi:Ala-tRNA(Pro) deacylase